MPFRLATRKEKLQPNTPEPVERILASLFALCLLTPAWAQSTRVELKGKQIKLSILGVAGWLPSKLPYDMSPEFAKYAKEKYGYDVTFTYADAPFGGLFQKAE
jgi:hypothetical protein